MSDGQPRYAPDWYRKMQRDQAIERKAKCDEAEQHVRAILADENEYVAQCLLEHLINADPFRALEMLVMGGHHVGGENRTD